MWKISLSWFLIAALLGCEKLPSTDSAAAQKITVAYTVQPQSTLVNIALAKGYFAEEGLQVQPLVHTFGRASLQSLLDHKADFATVAETPVMFAVLKGEKIFVIANIEASTLNNAIVARKDAGISAAADLKGKRIGYTPGTTSEFFLDSLLTANGLTRQQVKALAVKPEEMQEAIMAGKVDAVCTWNYPLTQIKRLLGSNGTVLFDREIYTETFNVAAQQDYVRKNPETVKRFLRAMIKAENFAAKKPEESQSIVSTATTTSPDLVREVWPAFNYRVVLDQTLLITLEDETRWAMKNRLTEETLMPDYMNFIHTESLQAVKPEAVRMHR